MLKNAKYDKISLIISNYRSLEGGYVMVSTAKKLGTSVKAWGKGYWLSILRNILLISCIAFLSDYLDLPSAILSTIPVVVWTFAGTAALGLGMIWLIKKHIFDYTKIPLFNIIDEIVVSFTISGLIYSILAFTTALISCYKVVFLVISFLSEIIYIHKRYSGWIAYEKKQADAVPNVVDLKDIFEGKISAPVNTPVFIAERPAKFDLLGMDSPTFQLMRSISNYRGEESFVISLEGEWGCGKTSIINYVKSIIAEENKVTEQYIVIDDFDPWLCGNEEALLNSMFNSLLRTLGIRINPQQSRKALNEVFSCMLNYTTNQTSIGRMLQSSFFFGGEESQSVPELKKELQRWIASTQKTIIFFIDNLDRASNDNIVFLFKLISIVFDIPGIVYVLSFENSRVEDVFGSTRDADKHFTEKIIQERVLVPPVAENAKELYRVCMYNLLFHYGITPENMGMFQNTISFVCREMRNIRQFIRYINSVFSIVFCEKSRLDCADLLAIETINFFDRTLFDELRKNAQFFITYDLSQFDRFRIAMTMEERNKSYKDYLCKVLVQYSNFSDLLQSLFPNVKKAMEGTDIFSRYGDSTQEYQEVIKRSRMCSAKFYPLYFLHGSNHHVETTERIERCINQIKQSPNYQTANKSIQDFLAFTKTVNQRECFERFEFYIPDLTAEQKAFLAQSLLENLNTVANESTAFVLNPQSRCRVIIAEALLGAKEENCQSFFTSLCGKYNSLQTLSEILYWMRSEKVQKKATIEGDIYSRIQGIYEAMCLEVIQNGINIFSSQHYSLNNSYGLHEYLKEEPGIFKKYILASSNKNTIYRILGDMVSTSLGNEYGYYIKLDAFNQYFDDPVIVDEFLDQCPPRNEDEQFIYSIYQKFRSAEKDDWDHSGVMSPVPRSYDLASCKYNYAIEQLIS